MISKDEFFSLSLNPSKILFLAYLSFLTWIFNNAVTLIAVVRHIVMALLTFNDVIKLSDVNLNDNVRDVLYNLCTSNTLVLSIFIEPG